MKGKNHESGQNADCTQKIVYLVFPRIGDGRLGVLFRGGKYAVEVKLKKNYEKNREKAYEQVCRYMDHLGVPEGWIVVFDPDLTGDWDAKLSHEDIERNGKAVHVFRC